MNWESRKKRSWRAKLRESFRTENTLIREFLAEFLGTLVLVLFGCSSIAQAKLSHGKLGSMLSINLSWGLGLAMGAFIAGNISGAHLNPAVSLAMFMTKKMRGLNRLLLYILAQYLGAFVASILVFLVYFQALNNFDGGTRALLGANGTADIWASYPSKYLSYSGGLIDQIVATMLLVLCVMAITDSKGQTIAPGLAPLLCGLVVVLIGMTFGLNCGYPINPARDLSPRLYTAVAGWGSEVFSFQDYVWFLIPIFGPHVGAILGAVVYLIFIGNHLPGPKQNREFIRQFPSDNHEDYPLSIDRALSEHRASPIHRENLSDVPLAAIKKLGINSSSQEDMSTRQESMRHLRAHQSSYDIGSHAGAATIKLVQYQQLKASVDALRKSVDALKD